MRVVIIGAGYAGLSCALRLSRKAPRDTQITLINAGEHFIERIRLHEQAAGTLPVVRPLSALIAGTSIELRVGWAEQLDLAGKSLTTIGGEQLGWDRLVLALGSQVDVDIVPGVREHAHTLDGPATGWLAALIPSIAARRGKIAIVGGGLTGIEVASELAEAFPTLSVALITRGEVAPGFAPAARSHVRRTLARLGVSLREHVAVREVEPRRLITADGPLAHAACIWASGFRAPSLAAEAGLAVNTRGQAWVDPTLRACDHPDVYVAGDALALREPLAVELPMGCKSAFPTGFHVAENLARELHDKPIRPFAYGGLPYCVSLGRRDGLLQLPGARPRVLTGGFAARIKEFICTGTTWALALERQGAALAARLRFGRQSALLPMASARGEPS